MKLTISVMGCVRKLALAVCAAVCSGSALAEVVAWYRFSELAPGEEATTSTVIENYAAPGTLEGTVNKFSGTTIGGSDGILPVGTNSFGARLQIWDPLTGQYHTNNRAMHFGARTALNGATSAPGSCYTIPSGSAGAFDSLTNITVEAIFRLNADTPDNFTACIVDKCGTDGYKNRWSLMIDGNGRIWSRFCYCNIDGSNVISGQGKTGSYVSRGVWHHAAFTFAANGDVNLYLDYEPVATDTYSGCRLETAASLFAIGCNPKISNRTFPGEIDEVRISDCALAPEQFLRVKPVVEGLDPDTVFYLPFDFDEGTIPLMTVDINAATNAGALVAKFDYLDSANSVPQCSADIPGTEGQLRQNVFAPSNTNYGSMYSVTNVPNKATSIRISDPTRSIYTGSFTAEMFFKGDTSKINSSGSALTLMYGQLKVLVNATGTQTASRAYDQMSGYTPATSEISKGSLNLFDGEWHHVAIVYDYAPSNFTYYVDYVQVGSKTTRIYEASSGSKEFYFGRQKDPNGAENQHFPGWQDSLRIVRRALKPQEFLTTHAVSKTLAHMSFDTNYSVQPYPELEPAGNPVARTGGQTAQIVPGSGRKVWLDGLGMTELKENAGCVRIDGSQVAYRYNPLLERKEFTVEFFAKLQSSGAGPDFIRLNRSTTVWNTSSTWSFRFNEKTRHLSAHAYMQRFDGSFNDQSPDFTGASGKTVPSDGRWHHYALTSQLVDGTNTMLTAYIDYKRVGEPITLEGVFYYPESGTCLAVGAGDMMKGWIDELRFSDGVLPVSSFMRFQPHGFTITFR